MVANSFAEIHDRYSAQYGIFDDVADYTRNVLVDVARSLGLVEFHVSARAKEIDSVVQKLCIRKPDKALEELRDRAGARLTVTYLDDARRAIEALKADGRVDVRHDESKIDQLHPDQVGYLGYHADVVVPVETIANGALVEGELWCEVQIRTTAQSAWAVVSHDLGYKQDELPKHVERRLNRVMALVELMDEQFDAVRQEVVNLPGHRVRRALAIARTVFARFTARESHVETSLAVLPSILQLYTYEEIERLKSVLDAFASANEKDLKRIYSTGDTRTAPLVCQPEGLLVLERLNTDPFAAHDRWPTSDLPLSLLTGLATADGRPGPIQVFSAISD